MPEGSDETGGSASATTNSVVVTAVAVEVGGLQPFQVKGDPHSISQRWSKWKRAFELYILGKGSQVTRRNVAFCFTRPASRCRMFILLSCLVVKIRITPPHLRY